MSEHAVITVDHPDDTADAALRAARAEVARLTLSLRALTREEAAVVREEAAVVREVQSRRVDDGRLSARRTEMADEVVRVRDEARAVVAAATEEAAAITGAAAAELLLALVPRRMTVEWEPAPAAPIVAVTPVVATGIEAKIASALKGVKRSRSLRAVARVGVPLLAAAVVAFVAHTKLS